MLGELEVSLLLLWISLQVPVAAAVVVRVVVAEGSALLQREWLAEQAERAALLSVGQTQLFRIKWPQP